MTLLLAALLAQAPADVERAIASVEIHLPVGADPHLLDRVTDLVTLRKGQTLSRKAVRESLQNLFATGRFSDMAVRVSDLERGVAVVFEVVPKLTIGELYVEGNRTFSSQELLAATRLSVRDEYWPERIAQATQTLSDYYARRGYRSTRIDRSITLREGGVDVGFLVAEGAPTRISALSIAGAPGLPLAELQETLGTGPGDVLDLEKLGAGVEALRARLRHERFYRARVEAPEVLAETRVVIPLNAGPRYQVVFRGNRVLPDTSLRAMLGYEGGEALDSSLVARLAQRLERFYRFRGFHDVKVRGHERGTVRFDEAELVFDVEEGGPLRVESLSFDGNTALTDRQLREALVSVMDAAAPEEPLEAHPMGDPQALEGRMGSIFARSLPKPPLHTVFEESEWREAARAMTALYREQGYLSASVQLAGVELQNGRGRARFAVTEGPQARFRSLQLESGPAGFKSDAVEAHGTGGIFSVDDLDSVRQAVTRELGRKGYLFAAVESSFHLDPSGRHADCQLTVKAGPQVRTRRVLAVGQVHTRDEVILAQATMREGQPLDSESLFTTQNSLMQLGIFRTVDVEMLSPEVPEPQKTVVVRVKERPPISTEVGLGYFLADGPRVVVDLTAPNLAGRAIYFNGHFQLNAFPLSVPALNKQVDLTDVGAVQQIGGRANVSLQNRGLLPANIGVRLDVVAERVFRPQFRFTRVAAVPSLDWSTFFEIPRVDWARPKLTLQLQYELESSWVQRTGSSLDQQLPLTLLDQERLRFLYGTFALQSGRFSPTIDLRDNALVPHRGLLLQGTAEVTGAIATEDEQGRPVPVNFAKFGGLATVYLPVARTMVLALSGRTGRIYPLVAGSVTPPVKRFFLGGSTSMRGFNEDQLLAEDQRAQYRGELKDCLILASHDGCTSAANAILKGKQVPAQGGESFALLKAELRFPAFGVFDLGVFLESGNLWLAAPKVLWPLRAVAGAGLRYVTPFGPVALDFGFNLAPDTLINEPQFVAHFNIGVF